MVIIQDPSSTSFISCCLQHLPSIVVEPHNIFPQPTPSLYTFHFLCQSDEKHKFYSIRVQEKMQIARPKQSHRLSTWNDHIQRYSAALAKTTDQTTHTHPFNGPFLGLPGWVDTRKVKPIWILLKQETVSGRGISWTVCKSAPRSRQITMSAPHHSLYWSDKEQKIKNIIRTNGSTSSLAWKRYSPPLLSLSRNTFGFFV